MPTHTDWAVRTLSRLLRQGDGAALLGDLTEEYARRLNRTSANDAAQWYRRELYWSLAAVLRLRAVECVRAVPWTIAAAAFVVVGLYEFLAVSLLSLTWPAVAQWTSALRLVVESPGIVAIAYVAATFRRSAAFVLGAAMLCVAALLNVITTEDISMGYVIASLVVGPLAAFLGGLLHRGPKTVASASLVLLVMTSSAYAQEPTPALDTMKTIHGSKSPYAPQELDAFAFLVGKWEGTGRTRLPDGKVVEFPITWIGRYILDGTAIEDEGHGPAPDGSRSVGINFRQYDSTRKVWIIEFLYMPTFELFRQVHQGSGSVTVSGRNVTVTSDGALGRVREHYLVPDDDHWVYRQEVSTDGGRNWNEGRTDLDLRRSK